MQVVASSQSNAQRYVRFVPDKELIACSLRQLLKRLGRRNYVSSGSRHRYYSRRQRNHLSFRSLRRCDNNLRRSRSRPELDRAPPEASVALRERPPSPLRPLRGRCQRGLRQRLAHALEGDSRRDRDLPAELFGEPETRINREEPKSGHTGSRTNCSKSHIDEHVREPPSTLALLTPEDPR
jgi:hypothetical protein